MYVRRKPRKIQDLFKDLSKRSLYMGQSNTGLYDLMFKSLDCATWNLTVGPRLDLDGYFLKAGDRLIKGFFHKNFIAKATVDSSRSMGIPSAASLASLSTAIGAVYQGELTPVLRTYVTSPKQIFFGFGANGRTEYIYPQLMGYYAPIKKTAFEVPFENFYEALLINALISIFYPGIKGQYVQTKLIKDSSLEEKGYQIFNVFSRVTSLAGVSTYPSPFDIRRFTLQQKRALEVELKNHYAANLRSILEARNIRAGFKYYKELGRTVLVLK